MIIPPAVFISTALILIDPGHVPNPASPALVTAASVLIVTISVAVVVLFLKFATSILPPKPPPVVFRIILPVPELTLVLSNISITLPSLPAAASAFAVSVISPASIDKRSDNASLKIIESSASRVIAASLFSILNVPTPMIISALSPAFTPLASSLIETTLPIVVPPLTCAKTLISPLSVLISISSPAVPAVTVMPFTLPALTISMLSVSTIPISPVVVVAAMLAILVSMGLPSPIPVRAMMTRPPDVATISSPRASPASTTPASVASVTALEVAFVVTSCPKVILPPEVFVPSPSDVLNAIVPLPALMTVPSARLIMPPLSPATAESFALAVTITFPAPVAVTSPATVNMMLSSAVSVIPPVVDDTAA